jgi:Tfp pilus assembly protein PilE
MGSRSKLKQRGVSLVGFIFLLAIAAVLGVLALRTVPSVVEYFSIKKAIVHAKQAGSSPTEIRRAFDRQAQAGYITTVSGKDLHIVQADGGFEVGFAYEKVIPLVGPASLLLEYEGSTDERVAQRLSSQ